MLYSTLTSKGQTTIPARIRDAMRLKPGDRLIYEITADGVRIRVHPGAAAVHGMLAGKNPKGSPAKAREVAKRAWAAHAQARGLPA